MIIFKYEMKRHLKYMIRWTITLALCIFLMIPVYYSFIDMAVSSSSLYETLSTSDFYKSVGVSMEYLSSPLGIYSFLTSFFMLASGVFGMHFGISIYTREFREKTSEYLFTKPHTRRTVFLAKTSVVFCGTFIVSAAYVLASLLALVLFHPAFPRWEFFLISGSLFLLTLLFAAAGIFTGTLFSNNRSPLLTAGMVIFTEYCITS